MIITIEEGRYFHITGNSPDEVQAGISAAVDIARQHAALRGWEGVLIKRHYQDSYTVAVSPLVPYGVVGEREG